MRHKIGPQSDWNSQKRGSSSEDLSTMPNYGSTLSGVTSLIGNAHLRAVSILFIPRLCWKAPLCNGHIDIEQRNLWMFFFVLIYWHVKPPGPPRLGPTFWQSTCNLHGQNGHHSCVDFTSEYHLQYYAKTPMATLLKHLGSNVCSKFHKNRGILKPISLNHNMGLFLNCFGMKIHKTGKYPPPPTQCLSSI